MATGMEPHDGDGAPRAGQPVLRHADTPTPAAPEWSQPRVRTLQVHVHTLGADGVAQVTFQSDATLLSSTFRVPAEDVSDTQWQHLEAGVGDHGGARRTGTRLFEALFHERHAINLFHEVAAGGAFVRLRLITSDARVAGMPWELMVNPSTDEFLARGGSVVRWLVADGSMPVPSAPLAVDEPIRALVVWSSPAEDPLPSVREEAEGIGRAYHEASLDGRCEEAVVLGNPDRRAVADAIREAEVAGRPFHVLHYAGHAATDDRGRGLIRLGGADGVVDAEELAAFVQDSALRLVVLNACSALGSGSTLPAVPDFARRLSNVGVPAIVGMQAAVSDDFAATVGADLHEALLDGRSVDHALTDVRRLIDDDTSSAAAHLGIPVVFLAPGQSHLVQPRPVDDRVPEPPPPVGPWEWLVRHKREAAWVTLAVLIPLVFTYLDIIERVGEWRAGPPPVEAMVGDLNMAVAGFTGDGSDGVTAFDGLDQSVFAQLSDTLGCDESGVGTGSGPAGLQYGCRGPAQLQPPADLSEDQMQDWVEETAGALQADVVVYGVVSVREANGFDLVTLRPRVYFGERHLADAPELVGHHLIDPVLAEMVSLDNAVDKAEFRGEVLELADAMSELVVGLAYSARGDFRDALAQMGDLRTAHPDFQPSLVGVVTGDLHGRLHEWDQAEAEYTAAARADPASPRPILGLGELAYQQGRGGDCQPGALDDAELQALTQAEQHFDDAEQLVTTPQPRVQMIAVYGRARVARCRTFAGIADQEAEARTLYADALALQAQHPRIGIDVAAEAHAALANLDLRAALETAGDAADELLRASLEHADAAIRLGPSSRASLSRFIQQRAIAAWRLGDVESACQDIVVADLQAQQGVQDDLRVQQLDEIGQLAEMVGCP